MKKFSHNKTIIIVGIICLFVAITTSITQDGLFAKGEVLAPNSNMFADERKTENGLNNDSLANCRYGVAAVEPDIDQAAIISDLGAGWFLNFALNWQGPEPANNAEFAHLFWVSQARASDGSFLPEYRTGQPLDNGFASFVKEHPGDLWIIGNEVDRGPDPGQLTGGQGSMYPEIYAEAYHDISTFIKKHDPSAQTAVSGLVQVTPGRLQYWDKVWSAYQQRYGTPMRVDVWNMHIYVLPEVKVDGITPNAISNVALGTDPLLGKRSSGGDWRNCEDPDVYCSAEHDDMTAFSEQVVAMRRWMKEHGQQQKPLILSEYSILYPFYYGKEGCAIQDEFGNCFTPSRVSTFMTNSFSTLNQLKDKELGFALDEDRLVQKWLWFSLLYEGPGSASNILEGDGETLTKVGRTLRQTIRDEVTRVNLVVESVPTVTLPAAQTGLANATVKVLFRNNGNTAVAEPFAVTFYENASRTIEIGSVHIDSGVGGCATKGYSSEVEWKGLKPGIHRFWVTVDSDNIIDEGNKGDNLASGRVVVNSESSHIPLIVR